MKYRNNKTGAIYELVGLVVDSNNDTTGPEPAEILYREPDSKEAVYYRRNQTEFREKFTAEPAE